MKLTDSDLAAIEDVCRTHIGDGVSRGEALYLAGKRAGMLLAADMAEANYLTHTEPSMRLLEDELRAAVKEK